MHFWHELGIKYSSVLSYELRNLLVPVAVRTLQGDAEIAESVRSFAYGLYGVSRRWVKQQGIRAGVHDISCNMVISADGLQPSPSAAILERQNLGVAGQGGVRGYDAAQEDNRTCT